MCTSNPREQQNCLTKTDKLQLIAALMKVEPHEANEATD